MSDIEKRKELSEEENFDNDSFNSEKKDETLLNSTDNESSQSADQGSVTGKKDQTDNDPADTSNANPNPEPEPAEPEDQEKSVESQDEGPDEEGDTSTGKPVPDPDLKTEIAELESGEGDKEESAVEEKTQGSGEDEKIESAKEEKTQVTGISSENRDEKTRESAEEESPGSDAAATEEGAILDPGKENENDQPAVEQSEAVESGESAEGEDEEGAEDGEIEEKDYSTFGKDEIIHEMEELLQVADIKMIEKPVRELKSFYDDIYENEKRESLQKFLDKDGAEVDFEYAGDALDSRFSAVYDQFKTRRNNYYSNLDKEKDTNLQRKHDVLEKLRNLVDGEETTTSIGALKEIQKEWKEIGPVPGQYAKSLWATYNALIDRFYDNRSIYFELKELDRKKNLEGKIELCERAEELAASENIKEAVKELNELHEEFKHIGPVPKEVQEEVWQRFKAASDAIYAKRKEFVGQLKRDLNENLKLKMDLVEDVGKFSNFDSDKITEWNDRTREILDLQKKWERIGGLPREHAREINKSFWSSFKSFFNNKNKFFKKLEGQRDDNLKLKEELVQKAEVLMESEDWEETAETLKDLQKEWKNIGPVPEKFRNEIYKKFKAACDTFFERRRSHSRDVEGDYRENLKIKEKICDEIEKMVNEGDLDADRFRDLQVKFDKTGFVPRNAIRKIQKKYDLAVNRFLETVDLPGAEKSELKFAAEVNRLKSGPNSDQRIQRKESELRRMIGKLENDIALWRNNLEFFADSKTADKLRDEFSKKIDEASEQLNELKEELKVLNKID